MHTYPENPRWRAPKPIQTRAVELRQSMTPAEQMLWQALRGNALNSAHFRRQHAIGTYILDFYCAKAKLAIEIDGGIHLTQETYDFERDIWLQTEHNIRTIRFTNDDVLHHLNIVLDSIRSALIIH